jgi:RNA polymerase primary sigma factor
MQFSEVFSDSCLKSYFDSLSGHKLLSAEEEVDLSNRKKSGEREAGEKLVTSNLRLVVKIAKGFSGPDSSLTDLIQEGNIGLIRAAEKFDPSLGCRFSTYASYWIKHYISRYIAKTGRMIRIPIRKNDIIKKIVQVRESFLAEHGTEPTVRDLSLLSGVDEKNIQEVLCFIQPSVSLEVPLFNEDSSLHDVIGDEKGDAPYDEVMRQELRSELRGALDSLMENEKEILEMRYGFAGDGECTLKEAGRHFGISAETVRQIEMRAISKIRQRYQYLSCYID